MIFRLFPKRPDHPLADGQELKRILAELHVARAQNAVDEVVGWFESLKHAEDFRLDHLFDVLKATFPAGTVSGAPKVRAMEIIDELEPVKRGIYAGAVGYLGFNGDMDLAIAIRTAIVKDGQLHVQAGAGIVADSDPASEWQETQSKARAVLRAAELAEHGLDTRW